MNASKFARAELIEIGREYHQDRVDWLSADNPVFSDNVPVDGLFRMVALKDSQKRLAGDECMLACDGRELVEADMVELKEKANGN